MMNKRIISEKEHFDILARKYKSAWWGNRTMAGQARLDTRAQMVIERVALNSGARILELGCATGDFTRRFANVSCSLISVDCCSELIEIAKRNGQHDNITYEIVDIEELSYPDSSFDGVIGNAILHHLNLDKCLYEIYRVLKSQGTIVFFEPNLLNPQVFLEAHIGFLRIISQCSAHEQAFTRWGIQRKLGEVGFKDIEVVPFDFLHPFTPPPLINLIKKTGGFLEKIPIVKEIAGSLFIKGAKR